MPRPPPGIVPACRSQAGLSYIEVIVAIVVIGIAFTGLLAAIGGSLVSGSDPERRYEALSVAQSYMDEIQAMANIIDPLAVPGLAVNLSQTCIDQAPPANTPRFQFNEICDYSGLSQSPRNRDGQLISGLEYLTVDVNIFYNNANARMVGAGGGNAIGGANSVSARNVARIDITVSYTIAGATSSVFLSSYVTRPCDAAGVLCPCGGAAGACP